MKRWLSILLVGLAMLSACGGQTLTDTQQIHATAIQYVQKLRSGDFKGASLLTTNPAQSFVDLSMVKAFGYDAKSSIPNGYENQIEVTHVSVTGSTATMDPVSSPSGDRSHWTKIDGQWKVEYK